MKTARFTGWVFITLGLFAAGTSTCGEIAGRIIHKESKHTAERVVERGMEPTLFHRAVTMNWIRSCVYSGTGLLILSIIRRLDRLDPMLRDFAGQESLDALGRSLDRERKLRNFTSRSPAARSKQTPPAPQPKIII